MLYDSPMESIAINDLKDYLEDVLAATSGPFIPGRTYGIECGDVIVKTGEELISGCGEVLASMLAWDNQDEMWRLLAEAWTLHLHNDHDIGEWQLSG